MTVEEMGIDDLRNDLKFQLTFEQIDWDYFIETAITAKELQEKIYAEGAKDEILLQKRISV